MRDYRKNASRPRRGGSGFSGWSGLFIGLSVGLAMAAGVWMYKSKPSVESAPPVPKKPAPQSARDEGVEKEPTNSTEYTFYSKLKTFEVVIPEKEKDVHRDAKPAPETRPGSYVLQVGSYKNIADADRVRAKLALVGVESKIQTVTLDSETWQRVRIGPISNLDELNKVRTRLRQAEVDTLVMRVGD